MTTTTYPYGYGTTRLDLDALFARLNGEAGGPMHPVYESRLRAWLVAQAGLVGVGDGWRPTPSNTSPASERGESFHQTQRFASGLLTWCAVDLVASDPGHIHRAVTFDEVPVQGSTWAAACGLHANVSNEPWHLQPTIGDGSTLVDGWQTWVNAGRPDPVATDPVDPDPVDPVDPDPVDPVDPDPVDPVDPEIGDDVMRLYACVDSAGNVWIGDSITRRQIEWPEWNNHVLRSALGTGPAVYLAGGPGGRVTKPEQVRSVVLYYDGGIESLGAQR